MRIHKEGNTIILTYLFFLFILSIILIYFFKNIGILYVILLTCLFFFIIWFFRNPVRRSKAKKNEVVAPVDGKVIIIKKVFVEEFLHKECIQISIFMSPLNIHVCRYPVSGNVVYVRYHPGKNFFAWRKKSSELNERSTCVIETLNQQKVLFRQIAGFIARRIALYTQINDKANAGEEYGFIKFGSRLDIFLPLDTKIFVRVGEIISNGGEKIIARLNFNC